VSSAQEFRALVLRETEGTESGFSTAVETLGVDALPEGEVTVAIEASTLNYKDGMILCGSLGRLVRAFPHVPGVDFAGTVEHSTDPRWKQGDPVVLTGWRVGEVRWGGYATRARVKADWLVAPPPGLSLKQCMAIGTAGFTSMLAIDALERAGMQPGQGPVLVTGATGGVGSIAVMLLAALGYEVVASTGKLDQAAYLQDLGASRVIDRAELSEPGKAPLEKEAWAGCVDSVGGSTLARVLAQTRARSAVAACGLAGGNRLDTTVLPFLLRGVSLIGIDSVMQPLQERVRAWTRLAGLIDTKQLDALTETVGLDALPEKAKAILKGQIRGRVVVDTAG
jgi:acrylyl-CoA reductase (NADPH)